MKKLIALFIVSAVVFACNSSGSGETKEGANADNAGTTGTSTASPYEEGLEMIGSLDCTTCHKISEKNIGPAYTEVAKKYEATEANIDSLAIKIIKGGVGVWGAVPMTEHPDLSMDSARLMVKYILSLRSK